MEISNSMGPSVSSIIHASIKAAWRRNFRRLQNTEKRWKSYFEAEKKNILHKWGKPRTNKRRGKKGKARRVPTKIGDWSANSRLHSQLSSVNFVKTFSHKQTTRHRHTFSSDKTPQAQKWNGRRHHNILISIQWKNKSNRTTMRPWHFLM